MMAFLDVVCVPKDRYPQMISHVRASPPRVPAGRGAKADAMRATSTSMTTLTTARAVRGARARTRGEVPARRGSAHVARAGKKMEGPYEARNEFVIPSGDGGVVRRFEEEMRAREKLAKEGGATEAKLVMMKTNEYAFEQKWASKEAYEAYMNTPQRRRSHLTVGVYQRLPKDKWSVPDNFTPVTKA